MRTVRTTISTWLKSIQLGALGLIALGVVNAVAQPANDDFDFAEVLTGIYGNVTNNNTGATGEADEPSHAGFFPTASLWYAWTAPQDGEVALDTFGSSGLATNVITFPIPFPPFSISVTNVRISTTDTILAVYTGNNLATLSQVAANNDLYPHAQANFDLQNTFTFDTNHVSPFSPRGVTNYDGGIFTKQQSGYAQPYAGPSGRCGTGDRASTTPRRAS